VPSLRETLVFKGGTALKKCYFGDYRFSEDLDFSGLNGAPTGDALAHAARDACTTAAGGRSEAHRRLKLYVARTPELLHMRSDAVSELEQLFCTGDRVDLLFDNHRPLRAVVEVELGGEQNLIVGVHQAIKYRSLAAAERTMPLDTPQVRAFVISYEEPTAGVSQLARGYDVGVLSVDRERVLAPTA